MSALRKVLVVDDDPVVSKSFDRVLSNKGYEVVTAQNAAEALERIRLSEYDMVFTDIRMPGMDGVELAETVKARRPWTPVVIVTGFGTKENEQRAKAAGVTAFLHKPLSPEMIEGCASDTLQQAAAEAELPAAATAQPIAMPAELPMAEPQVVRESRIKNVALFLAAPFIGLVYAMFLPLVGLGTLVWMGSKEMRKPGATDKLLRGLKLAGKIVAAPFVGLAYVVFLPFVGLVALAWVAVREVRSQHRPD